MDLVSLFLKSLNKNLHVLFNSHIFLTFIYLFFIQSISLSIYFYRFYFIFLFLFIQSIFIDFFGIYLIISKFSNFSVLKKYVTVLAIMISKFQSTQTILIRWQCPSIRCPLRLCLFHLNRSHRWLSRRKWTLSQPLSPQLYLFSRIPSRYPSSVCNRLTFPSRQYFQYLLCEFFNLGLLKLKNSASNKPFQLRPNQNDGVHFGMVGWLGK